MLVESLLGPAKGGSCCCSEGREVEAEGDNVRVHVLVCWMGASAPFISLDAGTQLAKIYSLSDYVRPLSASRSCCAILIFFFSLGSR
jgi:hypothetical protein